MFYDARFLVVVVGLLIRTMTVCTTTFKEGNQW